MTKRGAPWDVSPQNVRRSTGGMKTTAQKRGHSLLVWENPELLQESVK
jgi:hypothetical protein